MAMLETLEEDSTLKIQDELEATLKRITSLRGVVGTLVVGDDGLYFPTVINN